MSCIQLLCVRLKLGPFANCMHVISFLLWFICFFEHISAIKFLYVCCNIIHRTIGLGQTSDTEKTDSLWIGVGIIVVASVPIAALVILNYIKCGMIVDDETRRKQNNRFTWNVAAIAVFNMLESTAQATLHVYMGIAVFQNIKPDLYPKAGLFNVASLWYNTWQCIAMLLSADFFMYFLHRSYHENKWLYRNLHCIHHEYRQVEHPIWCLFYVHPLELFLDNLAFFSGMHIMPTTMFNVFVYGTVSGLFSAAGHSGVLLPRWADKFLDTSFHQLHHSRWRCNYGEHFTLIDRLFGTYVAMPEEHKEMRRKQQQRHASSL
jgi:sterol desaturase/sphingolipid hydroxylase (fatty acid hydroxylase superfamily)